jgi:hypothetical protein
MKLQAYGPGRDASRTVVARASRRAIGIDRAHVVENLWMLRAFPVDDATQKIFFAAVRS